MSKPEIIGSTELRKRIMYCHALINCENKIDLWIYNKNFELIRTTSANLVLNTILEHAGSMDYMKSHFSKNSNPIILSSFLGLMWCADKSLNAETGMEKYYVLGPVFNAEVSLDALRTAAFRYGVEPSWRQQFINLMYNLSTVPTSLFFQFGLMMHYAITDTYITVNDLAFQHSAEYCDGKNKLFSETNSVKKDRATTYYMEKRLLDNIRNGKSNYTNDFINARKLSNGVNIITAEPLQQTILSCTTFISLCTRAAIEGGLTPDTAYTVGDGYIQAVLGCKTITDLRTVTHKMYDDFIALVQKKQSGKVFSKQIQSCIDYMETHIFENVQLHDLAEHTGYTDYYLSHKFKEETGMTVSQFIKKEKLRRSAELLSLTNDSVAKISEKLHFCSSSYFSTQFRKEYGVLPQQYREANKKI